MAFKSGFVTVIGRPNVGKSTLVNKIAGEKISIISDKPQTTRNAIKTIITEEDCQIIFIDTPGIHRPKNKLGEYMVNMAEATLNEVDVLIHIIEAVESKPGPVELEIIEQLKYIKTPIILVINKIDLVKKEKLLSLITTYSKMLNYLHIIPISALKEEGIDVLVKEIKNALPEGPKYFPDDMLTDQTERVLQFLYKKYKNQYFLLSQMYSMQSLLTKCVPPSILLSLLIQLILYN